MESSTAPRIPGSVRRPKVSIVCCRHLVENDYNLLVRNLNEFAKTISSLRDEVERRRLQEAREQLEPNQTDWVNLIGWDVGTVDHVFNGRRAGVKDVLGSKPGTAVFSAQPPTFPESP